MSKAIYIILLLLCAGAINAQTPVDIPRSAATPVPVPANYNNVPINYVRSWEPAMPSGDSATIAAPARTVAEVRQSTEYFDGLGRPIQSVVKGLSPSGKDMITPTIYDQYGREQYKYLPFTSQTAIDGKFKLDPFAQQKLFYSNATLMPGTAEESVYYNKTDFDASPLNRPLRSYAPGNSWAKKDVATGENGGNRFVKNSYETNGATDSVRIWTLAAGGIIPTSTSIYAAGQLYKNSVIDEMGNQVIEYRNKDEQVILKKTPAPVAGTAHVGWLCTYYVYDDKDNLRMIIPPKAVQTINGNWIISAEVAKELCFIYRYDGRGRLIVKKLPGADSTEMVYDVRDRLAFSRSGNMKGINWLVTFYDNLNRPTMTALYNNASTREALQATMNTATSNTQSISYTFPGNADLILDAHDGSMLYQATNSITLENGFDTGQGTETALEINALATNGNATITVSNPLPNISESELTPLTYTFYGDYSFAGKYGYVNDDIAKPQAGSNPYAETLPATPSTKIRGLVTGAKVRVLGTNQWLTTTNYYNDKGRIIQSLSDNISGGVDVSNNLYDFNGKLLSTYLKHKNPRSTTVPQTTLLTMVSYDASGRVTSVKKRLNDIVANEKTISASTYNETGQLLTKRLGVTATGQLETLKYEYNIRGWLKGINKEYANTDGSTANWFGQDLSYDYGFTLGAQFSGDIAGARWKSKSNGIARLYSFGYDKVTRLTSANFLERNGTTWGKTSMDFTVNNLTYDANGNILTLNQMGKNGAAAPSLIDQLTYTYRNNSNKLAKVADPINTAAAKLGDFNNGINTGDDYDYDANGNLIKDENKNITLIRYNFLNLPDSIVITGKGNIVYRYDASGNKVKKIVTDVTGGTPKVTTTDYIGSSVYKNDSLQYISHEEGRIRASFKTGQPVAYNYDYFIKDHLGNTRLVLTDQTDLSMYTATMETTSAPTESALFSNIDNTRAPKPIGYPSNQDTAQNQSVSKLTALNEGKKIGPSLVLRVMAGDTFRIKTNAFYKSIAPAEKKTDVPLPENMVADLVQAFSGSTASNGTHGASDAGASTPFNSDFYNTDYQRLKEKDSDPAQTDRPKAYLNFVLFDDQFKLVDENSGVRQVKAEPDQLQTLGQDEMVVSKSGFLYVYTSNESPQDVFFDDVTVALASGPLLEETHYYPFGLTMVGISSNALRGTNYPGNRKKYNGIEFTDELDLDIYDAQLRNLDPQIGRWNQVDPKTEDMEMWSPYASNYDNPIRYQDFLGDSPFENDRPRKPNRFINGVATGFAGYFQNIGNAIANPSQTLKGMLKPKALIENVLNNATFGALGTAKTAADNVSTVIKEGSFGLGKVLGNTLAELSVVAATEGAGKGMSSIKTAAQVSKLSTRVENTALSMQAAGQFPATIVGAVAKGGETAIGTSGKIPSVIAPNLEAAAIEVGGVGAKNAGNVVGCCGEFRAANELMLNNKTLKPTDIKFTPAIRPRTMEVIIPCDNCRAIFKTD
ncbi:DUF6443 domain-containing protein [Chitinophaga sp. OAE865]|uniref:DUF6443 domain-containing protein n=1 Tax=Chitinophaga sp. OAE865 TaxID=2817898 RepID=UPI001AE42064